MSTDEQFAEDDIHILTPDEVDKKLQQFAEALPMEVMSELADIASDYRQLYEENAQFLDPDEI